MRISDWSSDVCSSDLDDLVLADGQLRERVAAAVVLPREATCGHVVLLPDAIDVDVDVVGALRAAAKLGFTVVGRGEQHPGHGIREGQEVAGALRKGFDLLLGHVDRKSTRLNSSH